MSSPGDWLPHAHHIHCQNNTVNTVLYLCCCCYCCRCCCGGADGDGDDVADLLHDGRLLDGHGDYAADERLRVVINLKRLVSFETGPMSEIELTPCNTGLDLCRGVVPPLLG